MMNDSYFWAWRRLKYRTNEFEDSSPKDINDAKLVETIIASVVPKYVTKGDGRFNRVVNYISGVCETLEWLKKYWRDDDDTLTAFVLGIEVACQALYKEIKLIDQKSYEEPTGDWRKP